MRKVKTIHIHQANLRQEKPAVIVKTYKGSHHCRSAQVIGPCEIIQLAKPDSCGARCVIRTRSPVVCDEGAVTIS